jgi:hypothetical protein
MLHIDAHLGAQAGLGQILKYLPERSERFLDILKYLPERPSVFCTYLSISQNAPSVLHT